MGRQSKVMGARLLAVCALLAGCSDATTTQVVTGQVSARAATAVRAVDGQNVVTAAQVHSDGTFTLALPSGNRYRVEVLTATGVKHLYVHGTAGLRDLSFKVCKPGAPWDIGTLMPPAGGKGDKGGTGGTCDPTLDPTCKCDPSGTCGSGGGSGGPCEPGDPSCKCDPSGKCTGGGGGCEPGDPYCGGGGGSGSGSGGCKPGDPTCGGGGGSGSGGCKPGDPTCGGGGGSGSGDCDPGDPGCKCDAIGNCGTGCDPAKDPYCKCEPGDPSCAPSCNDPTGKTCSPPPPPPCKDPTDPSTCKDECANDPWTCGCPSDDPTCWGDPGKPKCDAAGNCSADGALMPVHPPGDFGCVELD